MINTKPILVGIILANLLFHATIHANNGFNDELGILDIEKGDDNLYVNKPSQTKGLSSMTYLVDSPIINNDLLTIFKSFADDIDNNHGATYLTTDSNKLKTISPSGSLKHVTEFTSRSSCDFYSLGSQAYAIFEIFETRKCFEFPIKSPSKIIQALNAVQDGIRKYSSLSEKEQIAKIHADIDSITPLETKTLEELKQFASFLVKQHRT